MAVVYDKALQFAGDSICTIDLNGFNEGDKVVVTHCQHIFHAECLKEWIHVEGRERKCPNCNSSLENFAIHIG